MLKIGEIAKEANVGIQTIRYYEKRNLIKPKTRKDSGYRLFEKDTVKTILFIKHSQELGFTLKEIKDLLSLRASTPSRCKKVRERAKSKLEDVREKIRLLSSIEKTLTKLIRDCEKNKTSKDCPIIEGMEN